MWGPKAWVADKGLNLLVRGSSPSSGYVRGGALAHARLRLGVSDGKAPQRHLRTDIGELRAHALPVRGRTPQPRAAAAPRATAPPTASALCGGGALATATCVARASHRS